jgi:hypothetical protein
MILSVVCFVTYVAWAIVPDHILISFGISYFPNKYWAVALPLYFIMLALFTVTGYIALSMYRNPDLNDLRLAEDKFSKVPLPFTPSPVFMASNAFCRATLPARASRSANTRDLFQHPRTFRSNKCVLSCTTKIVSALTASNAPIANCA